MKTADNVLGNIKDMIFTLEKLNHIVSHIESQWHNISHIETWSITNSVNVSTPAAKISKLNMSSFAQKRLLKSCFVDNSQWKWTLQIRKT